MLGGLSSAPLSSLAQGCPWKHQLPGHMAYSLHRGRGAGAFHEAFVLELWLLGEYGCVTDSICHLPSTLSCWELKALGTPENEVNGGKLGVRKVILKDLKPSLD